MNPKDREQRAKDMAHIDALIAQVRQLRRPDVPLVQTAVSVFTQSYEKNEISNASMDELAYAGYRSMWDFIRDHGEVAARALRVDNNPDELLPWRLTREAVTRRRKTASAAERTGELPLPTEPLVTTLTPDEFMSAATVGFVTIVAENFMQADQGN